MNINSFVPYEITEDLIKIPEFDLISDYAFIKHQTISKDIRKKYGDLSDDEYYKLTIDGGGDLEFDDVYIDEIGIVSKNSEMFYNNIKICDAFIYDDIISWFIKSCGGEIYITPTINGYIWNLFSIGIDCEINVKGRKYYKTRYESLDNAIKYCIKNYF